MEEKNKHINPSEIQGNPEGHTQYMANPKDQSQVMENPKELIKLEGLLI